MADFTLMGFILSAAFWGFDFDGLIAVFREVIGAGAHVELACFEGELKAIPMQLAANPWHAFGGPFVEVHVSVQAAALFGVLAAIKGGFEFVEGEGTRREKAVGIKVTAGNGSG